MKFILVSLLSLIIAQCQTFQRAEKVSEKSWKLPWKKTKPTGYQNIKKSDFFEPLQDQDNASLSSAFNNEQDSNRVEESSKSFLNTQLLNHTSKLTNSEIDSLEQYRSPTPGTASEAALVVGLLKATLHQQTISKTETPSSFQESDTLGDSLKTNLGELSGLYEVDPMGALKQNHFLQSGKVTELALLATQKTKKSVVYDRQVSIAMNKRVDRWNRIHQKYQAQKSPQNESEPDQETDNTSTLSILNKLQPRQVRSKPTIKPLEEIDTLSDSTDKAGLNVVNESAVETLRQKAAAAYQSSLPIRSPKAKLRHLRKAKKYLEYAMNRYKGNNQSDKLQNNLEVVEEAINATKEKANTIQAQ